MPNMRIITTNVADTAATITSTSVVGTTLASYLQTDYKSQFLSSSKASAVTYTLTWGSDQTIGGVVLPCTNLSGAAQIKVVLKNSLNATLIDTTNKTACPGSSISQFTAPTGSSFQLGAVSKTAIWFPSPTSYTTVRTMEITLTDTNNPATNIDCGRIVCGTYWQPTYNASRDGLTIGVTDTSNNSRTDAGDFVSDRGFLHDELSLNLSLLTNTDRDNLLRLTRTVGINRNILVSVFPSDYTDSNLNNTTEQQYTVYGKRSNNQFNYVINGFGSSNLQITGW